MDSVQVILRCRQQINTTLCYEVSGEQWIQRSEKGRERVSMFMGTTNCYDKNQGTKERGEGRGRRGGEGRRDEERSSTLYAFQLPFNCISVRTASIG